MLTTVVLVIVLLAANAFFVAAEFALVKVRGFRIENLAEQGSATARVSLMILHNLEAYLAACQLGITMTSLGLGWIGEPAVAAILKPLFATLNLGDAALHTISFILGFLIFSSLHIVIGEQVPKTFAIRKAEPMTLAVAYPLRAFYIFCFPLNWFLNRASRSILNAFGVAEASHHEVYSGEELRDLIDVSQDHGMVRKQERDMLGGILDLRDVEVSEIMTHRKDMVSVDADAPVDQIVEQVVASTYTRLPVWRDNPDSIIGVVHAKDVLAHMRSAQAEQNTIDLAAITTPPWFIPDTTPLLHQLLAFRQRRSHLALVVDEYGVILGLVTLEDILEEIVGEIEDEQDAVVSGVERQNDGSLIVEGRVTVRDLNRQFDWNLPDEEASTIAGLVIFEARRIPDVGQSFVFHDFRLEILRRKRHQITLLRITPPAS